MTITEIFGTGSKRLKCSGLPCRDRINPPAVGGVAGDACLATTTELGEVVVALTVTVLSDSSLIFRLHWECSLQDDNILAILKRNVQLMSANKDNHRHSVPVLVTHSYTTFETS